MVLISGRLDNLNKKSLAMEPARGGRDIPIWKAQIGQSIEIKNLGEGYFVLYKRIPWGGSEYSHRVGK